ncbi:MAG TPA: hypothetical protein PKA63_02195 [Oligoflexia bacterium]|mgnify:CR=1 FL=1|nr:hypothetical protein [Oligoflexia bacterium]HMP47462.1 hypothetical protein [Oligoflexia bacterium]
MRTVFSHNVSLNPQKRCFVHLVFSFFITILFSVLLVEAQAQDGDKYQHKGPSNIGETRAEKIVEKNVDRTYKVLNKFIDRHGERIAEEASNQKDREQRFGHPGPERNPLDRFNGRLDPVRSWNEYVMDSRVILKEETFPVCLEPRLIAEKKDGTVYPYDKLNSLYRLACEANCLPSLLGPNRNWQVFSYYWPEHQISVNRAGAQMIDPEIVQENRGPDELYRMPTSISEDTDNERGKIAQVRLLENMGIPATDAEKFKDPDYRRPTREFHLRQDGELRYPGAMRPNAFWRAANARLWPVFGYKTNPNCFFNAIDPPTSQRKIVANRYDQGIFAILARYPEVRRNTDRERYQYTSPAKINIEEYKDDNEKQFRESLCASWRMGTNQAVYGELGKLGFNAKVNRKYKDYCLPGGYDLSGSMVSTEGTPFLQADAARAVMAAIWFGSTNEQLRKMNSAGKRLSQFTFYQLRANSSVPRYVEQEENPGENKSNIVFIDKLQRIYPTQPIGNEADGEGGRSSKGFRTDVGQRGSHCFRPEDIPNWSSEGRTNKSEWPLGIMTGVNDHYGETRWVVWNRRVACTCEDFGLIPLVTPACINLNHGDHEESVFVGTQPGGSLPPGLEKSIPLLRGYANQTTKPEARGFSLQLWDLNSKSVDVGKLGAGYTKPKLPEGQQATFQPGQPLDQNDFLLCKLAEDVQAPGSGSPKPPASMAPPKDPSEYDDARPKPGSEIWNDFQNKLTADEKAQFSNLTANQQQNILQTYQETGRCPS